MRGISHSRALLVIGSVVFALAQCCGAGAQQVPATPGATLRVTSDLVLTDVVVRDKKTGAPITGLKREDFSILEDGKVQALTSFDYEDVREATKVSGAASSKATTPGTQGPAQIGNSLASGPGALSGHRLIVIFVDTTSLQPEDLDRLQVAARDYINKQRQSADLVAVVSLGNTLSIDQDFTADPSLLLRAIASYSPGGAQGFTSSAPATANQVEDASSYTADTADYNVLNTDRELLAISTIARALAPIEERKSLLYFSGGISRDGIENQASLRAAINASARANMAIYSVDARGLQAISPLGDATTGSLRGTAAYNGAGLQNNLDANFNSQETMATLSSDTGGKAFFDSNSFADAFDKVQQDTASYYVLGFHSLNPVRDGRFRKLQIKVNREDVKLEYRSGYYAPADFEHGTRQDRERDLEAQLTSDLLATDVSLYMQPFFFRSASKDRVAVPVALLIPGSQIPFVRKGARTGQQDRATVDIIGQIKDTHGQTAAEIRDNVKLALDASDQAAEENIEYTTNFNLAPGTYRARFVVRENVSGKMGSFLTNLTVPDLAHAGGGTKVRLSSVVLSSQKGQAPGKSTDNPLLISGADGRTRMQLVPNLPHIFRPDQPIDFLYEVYDPASATGAQDKKSTGVKVLTSVEFLQGTAKVFETPLVEARVMSAPARGAVIFQFSVPISGVKDGLYTCQVNVIDDAGASFAFPRTAVLIRSQAGVSAVNAGTKGR